MERENKKEMLRDLIQREAPAGKLSCRRAFAIAAEAGCSPAQVGELCNELKVKIIRCQLGCF